MQGSQSEASRSLPVFRPSDQLPQFVAVLSEGPSYLEDLAEPANPGKDLKLGTLRAASSPSPIAAPSHHACLGLLAGVGESGLRNRVQQSCTLGSVRGEVLFRYGDPKLGTKPETADTDKVTLLRNAASSTRRVDRRRAGKHRVGVPQVSSEEPPGVFRRGYDTRWKASFSRLPSSRGYRNPNYPVR